ncbi:MAG: hypothetical protein Q4D13_02810 [Erysipelotrichaceae bacterium]|nr:hypothetical protein [Erysipelotrichaceae bacterium]
MIEIRNLNSIETLIQKIYDTQEKEVILKPDSFDHAGPWSKLISDLREKDIFCEFYPVRKLDARSEEDNEFVATTSRCGTTCHWDILR